MLVTQEIITAYDRALVVSIDYDDQALDVRRVAWHNGLGQTYHVQLRQGQRRVTVTVPEGDGELAIQGNRFLRHVDPATGELVDDFELQFGG